MSITPDMTAFDSTKLLSKKTLTALVVTSLLLPSCYSLSGSSITEPNRTDNTQVDKTTNNGQQKQTDTTSTQCGYFNPNEMKICTMQFDPVCVKERAKDGSISYRTAGNACSACSTAESVSYTPGECR